MINTKKIHGELVDFLLIYDGNRCIINLNPCDVIIISNIWIYMDIYSIVNTA